MKKRLLIILTLLLVVFINGCKDNIDTPKITETPLVVTEKLADETAPAPSIETKKVVPNKNEEKNSVKVEPINSEKPADETTPAPSIETKKVVPNKNKEKNSVKVEPINSEKPKDDINKCTLSVNCITALENITKLNEEKAAILPPDGIILPETSVTFYEGESAFNILTRELKKNKIHIDFESSPMYNTVYIKGISNLYEHDCGELSGWLYKVNGQVPSYGSSRHILKDGDKIEFVYTCDMGKDI